MKVYAKIRDFVLSLTVMTPKQVPDDSAGENTTQSVFFPNKLDKPNCISCYPRNCPKIWKIRRLRTVALQKEL